MGNLPFEATIEKVRSMLEAHKKKRQTKEELAPPTKAEEGAELEAKKPAKWLRKIRLGTFEDSGKCKG